MRVFLSYVREVLCEGGSVVCKGGSVVSEGGCRM